MAKKLNILIFPDPRLRKVAEKVTKFDKCLEKLANDMLDTMYEANGIGLAATQVDKHIRLVVMDLSEERNEPRIFVNPEYEVLDGHNLFEFEEGYHDDPQKMRKDITKFFEELKYKLYTVPKSENVMFRLRLDNYYRGDIVAIPNKDH